MGEFSTLTKPRDVVAHGGCAGLDTFPMGTMSVCVIMHKSGTWSRRVEGSAARLTSLTAIARRARCAEDWMGKHPLSIFRNVTDVRVEPREGNLCSLLVEIESIG